MQLRWRERGVQNLEISTLLFVHFVLFVQFCPVRIYSEFSPGSYVLFKSQYILSQGESTQVIHFRLCLCSRLGSDGRLQPSGTSHRRECSWGLQRHHLCLRPDGHGKDVHHGGGQKCARTQRYKKPIPIPGVNFSFTQLLCAYPNLWSYDLNFWLNQSIDVYANFENWPRGRQVYQFWSEILFTSVALNF